MAPRAVRRDPPSAHGLIAALIAFAIGSLLRRQREQPTRYIGARFDPPHAPARSARAQGPGNVRDVVACVLVPRHDEEQVG